MSGSAVLHLIQKMDDFKILPEFSSSEGKYGNKLNMVGGN